MVFGRDIVAFRVDGNAWHFTNHFAGQWIKPANGVDLIVKQFNPDGILLRFCRENINNFTANPVGPAQKFQLIAAILYFYQPADDIFTLNPVALHHMQQHAHIGIRIPQTVNSRYRCHNNRVTTFQ